MKTKFEIERRAKELLDSNPTEALLLYRRIWNEFYVDFNGYNALDTFQILKNMPKPDLDWATEIVRKFESEKIKNSFGWLIYNCYIKKKEKSQIILSTEKLGRLIELVPQKNMKEDITNLCPFVFTVFGIIEAYAEGLFNAKMVNEWLGRVIPEYLSDTPQKINTEQRGEIEIASDLEKYYSLKTKALLKLNRFDECKNLCLEALSKITNFHYDNDTWFEMRIALAEENLGNVDESEKIFKKLLHTKAGSDKWFLYKNVAELYFDQKKFDKAWNYAVNSSFYGNEPQFMIGLYLLQARILFKLNRPEEGKLLAKLICSVLKENEWNKKPEHLRLFKYYNIDEENIETTKTYLNKANNFWRSEKYGDLPVQAGIIKSVHRNNKTGKIRNEFGFVISFHKKDMLKRPRSLEGFIGSKVEFVVMESFDGNEIAENITVIEKSAVNSLKIPEELIGKKLTGRVKSIAKYGVFVQLDDGPDGLIHQSVFPTQLKNNFSEKFQSGDRILVEVIKNTEKGLQLKLGEK